MTDPRHPLARSLQRLQAAFWRRRALHWGVRAMWLMLLVPVLVIVGYYWQGWQFSPWTVLLGMAAAGLFALLWAVRPLHRQAMARRLDERLGLQSRLTTALEADPTTTAANPIIQRLLQESVEIATYLRAQINPFNRAFWLEMRTLIAVTALLSGLIVVNNIRVRVPNTAPAELPPAWEEPTTAEVLPPDVQLQPPPFQSQIQQPLTPAQVQAALEALAEALRDQAATRAAADALDRGDIAGAAEELRRLADQLDQLSEEAQWEIGQALQEAADNIGQNAPGLSEALEQGSQALQAGDQLGAAEALESLAEALESLVEEPTENAETEPVGEPAEAEAQAEPEEPGEDEPEGDQETEAEAPGEGGDGAGDGDGSGQQPSEAERLAAEGEPLELEGDSELESSVLQPAELDAEAGDGVTQDSPFARQPANAGGDLGPDPLSYPWEKREVIRSYFTP